MGTMAVDTQSVPGRDGRPQQIRSVSVMAPMFNEAGYIAGVAEDLAAQDYDGPLDIVVADGGSTDGSVEQLTEAARSHGLALEVIDNPERWVSNGLNRCLERANGDLLVRIDCHSRYPSDYIRRCVEASDATGADNVGGVLVASGRSPGERATACAMDSPFGGVGWTRHPATGRVDADTVPFGAFRRDVFDRVGGYDQAFVRNQDDELNLRIRLAGGRVVLDPAIRVYYTPRGRIGMVARQYYEYGYWKPAVMRKHRRPVSLRSLAPSVFVVLLAVLALLDVLVPFWVPFAPSALAAVLVVYFAAAVPFGVLAIRRRRESWRLLPRVVALFPTFHFAYGIGTLVGWVRQLRGGHRAAAGV
jgi:succinoglycan biosynthesis protein ExoA